MSSSKGWGVATLVIGVLLIAGGLIVRFVVYPSQAKFPDDVDTTRTYDGELAVILDSVRGSGVEIFKSELHHVHAGQARRAQQPLQILTRLAPTFVTLHVGVGTFAPVKSEAAAETT